MDDDELRNGGALLEYLRPQRSSFLLLGFTMEVEFLDEVHAFHFLGFLPTHANTRI